jgi:hypothetical protein
MIKELENVKDDVTKTRVNLQGHMLIISKRVDVAGSGSFSLADRGSVKMFTESSACRMRRYLRSCDAEYTHFITLTYPDSLGYDGVDCKNNLRRFIQQLKRKAKGAKWSAFWFLEYQSRGAIHFHIFTTEFFGKQWVAETWYRICGSDDKRHLAAGTRIEAFKSGRHGCCAYATKYAAKHQQKTVPENIKWCGRFWGVSGLRVTKEASLEFLARSSLPKATTRALEALSAQIISDLRDGLCQKMNVSREGVSVYVYKSVSSTSTIRQRIYRTLISATLYEVKHYLYQPYFNPELEQDICDE